MATSALTFNGRLPGVDCQPALPASPTVIGLDVAGFVGFAERGPLNVPLAVEDINQYRAVFGGDVILATDGGIPVYANLPGAIEAFFDNGGRRCYVVRVAGPSAAAARWQVPGLRLWQPDGAVEYVYLQAAWPGTWSNGYGVGTQLLTEPLAVNAPYQPASISGPGRLSLAPGSMLSVQVGDLIRLDLGPLLPGLYVTVAAVDRATSSITVADEVAFLTEALSPPEPSEQLLLGPDALVALPHDPPVRGAWRLQFELITRQVLAGAAEVLERWTSLGFNPVAPAPGVVSISWLDVVQPVDVGQPDQTRSMLLRADGPTLSLTGLFLPVGMDQLGSTAEFVDLGPGPSGETAVLNGADGLDVFNPTQLFLDPHLLDETVDSLLADADQLTVLSSNPLSLQGIHALIGIDEVAVLSVPDAVNLGWSPAGPPPPVASPAAPGAPPPPDWSDFRNCAVSGGVLTLATGDTPVATAVTDATATVAFPQPTSNNDPLTYVITQTTGQTTTTANLNPTTPVTDCSGNVTATVTGLTVGSSYTFTPVVTASDGQTATYPMSNSITAISKSPSLPVYPILDQAAGYDPTGLLAVHTAMIQLCAARSDMFAVLGVPHHFDTAATLTWVQQLTDGARQSDSGSAVTSPLSFAGFWYPWVRVTEDSTPTLAPLRDQPADGAVCGTIAAHELARGVWVAPANIPLRGPVGLVPAISATDTVRLFGNHANLLRRQPGAISVLSAHTLAPEPNLLQISVRRLIILLRKVALVEGNRYVFEPNSDRFRQLVQMRFDRLLSSLTRQGALAAYQIVTDNGVNTPDEIDNGQLIVSMQIAPTTPIEFITVTLIRAGTGLLDVVVG
jgi:Phage tail sheath C-terminal domain